MATIDVRNTTGFYFGRDAIKFKINITGIKIDDGARRGDLIHVTICPIKKYWSIDIALWTLANFTTHFHTTSQPTSQSHATPNNYCYPLSGI